MGAVLLKVSIAKTQGDIETAHQTCGKLSAIASPQLSLVCKAGLVSQEKINAGDEAEKWIEVLNSPAIQAAVEDNQEINAWRYSTMAELSARINNYGQAETYFKKSLENAERQQVKVAYADLLIKQDRHRDALDLLHEHSTSPAIVLRHLITETALGIVDQDEVEHTDALFRDWASKQDFRHAREMGLFYLEIIPDPEFALQLAEQNNKFQKEPEDLDLLDRARRTAKVPQNKSDKR